MTEPSRELTTYSPKPPSTTTSAKAIAVLLKPLIDLHGEPRNWLTAASLYIDALSDIPPELLRKAVSHAVASNPYFPKPADLRLSIKDELSEYRRRRDQEWRARMPKLPEPEPPTAEDFAYVTNLVAETLRNVRERSLFLERGEREGVDMRFLADDDPRRLAWEQAESPIEQMMACGLYAVLGCRAVSGEYESSRRSELAAIAGDKPAAFAFLQHKVGRYRTDFMVVMIDPLKRIARHFIIECDGAEFHSTEQQRAYDAERDETLVAAGYKFVHRVSGSTLHTDLMREIGRVGEYLTEFGIEIGPPADCRAFAYMFQRVSLPSKQIRKDREALRQHILDEEREEIRLITAFAAGEDP